MATYPKLISLGGLFTLETLSFRTALRNLITMWDSEHRLFNPLMEGMQILVNENKTYYDVFDAELLPDLMSECGFKSEYVPETGVFTLDSVYFAMLFSINRRYSRIESITDRLSEDVKFLRYLRHLGVLNSSRSRQIVVIMKDLGTLHD